MVTKAWKISIGRDDCGSDVPCDLVSHGPMVCHLVVPFAACPHGNEALQKLISMDFGQRFSVAVCCDLTPIPFG